MTGIYPRILHMMKINRKIFNTSKNNYRFNNHYYKNSFTTKYLINKYTRVYYTPTETIIKNRSLFVK